MSEDTKFIEKHTDEKQTTPKTFSEYYEEIKKIVESIEKDIIKSDKGIKSAKVSVRKHLRLMKTTCSDFVKFSLGKD
jgi:hypothetical protein